MDKLIFEFLTDKKTFTFIVIVLSIIIKKLLEQYFKKRPYGDDKDSRLMVNAMRNIINLGLVILLFVLWFTEVQHFAFSIAAFIVAIVLATRELIQCLIGFIYLSSTATFRIGDWIETGKYTGEVTSTDWMKITLLEVSTDGYSYTGKTVFIPNSQLMTQPIKNLNFMRRYLNHSFFIIKNDNHFNPFLLAKPIMERAQLYCQPFNDVAERYNMLIQNRLDISISGPEPAIEFTTTELGRIKAIISIFCPTEQAKIIEQKLMNDYLSLWQSEKDKRNLVTDEEERLNE
jgi:small-conductance mechanosensitive channel